MDLTVGPTLERRVAGRASRYFGASCLSGAVFVFLYLTIVAPGEPRDDVGFWVDVGVFVGFLAVSFPVVGWICKRTAGARLAWLGQQRTPTAGERGATLGLPARLAVISMGGWLVAAACFGVYVAVIGLSGGGIATVSLSIVDGGLVSSAVGYLLLERELRPVFALALAGESPKRPATLGVRPRLLLAWALGSGVPLAGLLLLPVAAAGATTRAEIGPAVIVLSVTGMLAGFLVVLISAKSVAEPLDGIRDALIRVRDGDLSVEVAVDDGGEVGLLQSGVNRMVEGLRERQRLADLFGRHVGTDAPASHSSRGVGCRASSARHRRCSSTWSGRRRWPRSCRPVRSSPR